jgi:hypothetical protein
LIEPFGRAGIASWVTQPAKTVHPDRTVFQ